MAFAPKPAYPTNAELATTGAINSTTLAAFVAFAETHGPPRDLVSNKQAVYAHVYINSVDNYGTLAGGEPMWQPTGCSLPTSADRTLRFGPMNRGLVWATGTGWPGAGYPATRTMAVVFRVNQPPIKGNHYFHMIGTGTGLGNPTLMLRDIPNGNNCGSVWQLALTNSTNIYTPAAPMLVESGKWYAAALSYDDSLGSNNVTRDWWLYDFAASTTYHQQQAGLTGQGWYLASPLRLTVGVAASNGAPQVWGADIDMYCALLDSQVWTTGNGNFGTWVADPLAPARGTYTPSGALTAGYAWVGYTGTTNVALGATPFRGGTGTVTGQWHRSAAANFTPSGATAISGATGLYYLDTPGTTPRTWYYKFQATDSSGTPVTVTYNASAANNSQILATLKGSAKKAIGLFGDSLTDNGSWIIPDFLSNFTTGSVEGINAGMQGATSGYTGATSQASPGSYLVGIAGTATGGTFTLSYGGTQTAAIAYNATAATIQTALQAIPALSGKVTSVAGGALPSVVFLGLSGGPDTAATDIVAGTNSLTGAAGTQVIPWVSCVARKAANLVVQRGGADAALMIGANDLGASTASMTANYLVWAQYFNAMGLRAILQCCIPRGDSSEAQTYWAAQYNAVSIPAVVSTINDATKCILGDMTAFDQIAAFYNKEYSDLVHPSQTNRKYLHPQAAAIAKMWSVPIGYSAAGGSSYTLAQIANAVWGDATSGDFTTPGTPGYRLMTGPVDANVTKIAGQTAAAAGAVTFPATLASTTNITGGTVAAVTNPVSADLQTIKGQAVTCSGGVTVPAATLASTTNITAGTITTATTATNLTNLPAIPANWLTAAGIAAGALNGKGDWAPSTLTASTIATAVDTTLTTSHGSGTWGGGGGSAPTAAAIATAVWSDATSGDFTTPGTPGYRLMTGVKLDLTQAVTTGQAAGTTGFALDMSGAASLSDFAAAVWSQLIDGKAAYKHMAWVSSVSVGPTTGFPTGPGTFAAAGGTAARVTAVVQNGNRVSVTLVDPTFG